MASAPYELKETLLKIEGVNVSYDLPILRDVNAEIKDIHRPGLSQGQVVALLGPSGMGKTTLFRIIAGLNEPDSGIVTIGPEGKPVKRGTVGVVAQNYPLFRHRSVLGNLTVAGKQSGLSAGESLDKANEMLKRFGLEGHGRKYPSQLSGGQKQRAAIAQQFMCSDHLLLMDEPFSGLDLNAVSRVAAFITEVACADETNTIIVVTHDISAAIEVSDTLWILGREKDARGEPIPGAKILHNYNLIERNLAWHEDVTNMPEYHDLVREIRELFPKL